MTDFPQDPTPTDPAPIATEPTGIVDRFADALKDPAVLELLVVCGLAVFLLLFFRRMGIVARSLAKRKELREYVRGLAALVNGDYADAVKLLDRVVERDPEHTDARIALGDAYYQLGDAAEAHRHHYHVESVFGEPSTRVSLCLGKDLIALGRSAEAVEHLEVAAKGDVEGPTARKLLVDLLADLGRERDAIPLVDGPIEETRGTLGRLHAAAGFRALTDGKERDGVKHLGRALDQNPGLLAPRMALVGRKWLDGDVNGAWSDFRRHVADVHQLAKAGVVLETGAPTGGLEAVMGDSVGLGDDTARLGGGRSALDAPSGRATGDGGEHAPPRLPPRPPVVSGTVPTDASDERIIDVTPERSDAVVLRDTDAATTGDSDGPVLDALQAVDPSAPPAAGMPEDIGDMIGTVIKQRARYRCAACGTAAVAFADACETCGAFGRMHSVRAAVGRLTEDVSDVVDEIEENRHYVGRLLERLVAGDEAAEAKLVRVGPSAIPEVFQRMMEVPDNEPLVRFLVRLGPAHLPLMVDAYQHMKTFGSRNILREGLGIFKSFDGVLTTLFHELGGDAVEYLERSLNHPDEMVRRQSLRAIVHLGRGDVLEQVCAAVPRRDVIAALNDSPDAALQGILRLAPSGPSAVAGVFADVGFERVSALAHALEEDDARDTAAAAIERRAFSAALADGLIERLREPTLAVAERLLRAFGADALDHLVTVYARPYLDTHRRASMAPIIAEHGDAAARALVAILPLEDGDDLAAVGMVFRAIGSAGLPALESRYAKSKGSLGGLLKMGLGLGRETAPPSVKADLLHLIGTVGGADAEQSLRRLAAGESDAECRRLIERLLREMN